MRHWLVFILSFTTFFPTYGQQSDNDWSKEYVSVLNLSYSPLLSDNRPEAIYLNAYYFFLNSIIDGDEEDYESFFIQLDNWSEITSEETEFNNYVEAEFEIMSGFLKLKFGHELSAAWSMRTAYRIARDNYQRNPDNPLFRKSWGLMQVLVGAIPDNYQWVPELFGIRGTIPTGISLLESIPESRPQYLEAQALIQLTRSYLFSESEKAARGFEMVQSAQPDSPLMNYLYLTLLQRAQHSKEVISHYEKLKNPLPLSTYAFGTALLQGGKYNEARLAFANFNKTYPGSDFKKDGAYKTFLTYYLEGDKVNAEMAFAKIKDIGSDNTEADRYAKKASGRPWPNAQLMKIRLATDGGFFDNAQHLIDKVQESEFKDPGEFTELRYRKARLAHLTGNISQAIEHYKETIQLQGKSRWYFAPNSCLLLGYIYLDKRQPEEAEYFFNKVKEYRGYEYQKGIERKAHSALSTHFSGS